MEEIKYPDNCIKVLDKGFVRLVDSMGDDSSIVQAARVSYGKGTKAVNEDRGLIRYLLRHQHTTPLEMVEFKFHMRMPVFVARQFIRHRTANVNEYSGRYSEMPDMFYLPECNKITSQSTTNKQGGSDEELQYSAVWQDKFKNDQSYSFSAYQGFLKENMRKELARINLPLSNYTEWYWKNDLNNILKFLYLRLDSHAQYEIRVFAEAMAQYVKQVCPIAYEAFEDYMLNSSRFSSKDLMALKVWFARMPDDESFNLFLQDLYKNKREQQEFYAKLETIANIDVNNVDVKPAIV